MMVERREYRGSWDGRLALWTALAVLCTNLAAINLLTLLGDESNGWLQLIAALITAVASAAAVFFKQRADDEKTRREYIRTRVESQSSPPKPLDPEGGK